MAATIGERRRQPTAKGGNASALHAENLVPSFGFAIFLVINATQVWGGIFPFLPLDFQTSGVTLSFYLAQSLAFVAAFAASVLGSYWLPHEGRRMLVRVATALIAVGSACIIAAMYVPAFTMQLVLTGGATLGVGTAAFFMLWQRYFAAMPAEECNLQLMVGTALSAILYFALHAVPVALYCIVRPARTPGPRWEDQVEIIRIEEPREEAAGRRRKRRDEADAESGTTAEGTLAGTESRDAVLKDRLSKQCLVARARFGLSTREAEVMELIARNMTVAAIAKELFVSENTVRTHSKHIYTKMDVHSKQELSQRLAEMEV